MCILGKCKFSASEKKGLCPYVPFSKRGSSHFRLFPRYRFCLQTVFLQVLTLNDLVLVTSVFFCSLSVRYLICSMALVPKVVLVSVLYFLVARFVSLVAAILSFFVCKPRV